jgi:hypothetical protein
VLRPLQNRLQHEQSFGQPDVVLSGSPKVNTVSFRQNPTKEDFANEAQAVFSRADRGGAEAGRGRSSCGGTDPPGGDHQQTLYRWKKQYKGLETDQVRQFKQLQEENGRLKRLVAELTLDKVMLQDVLAKKL